MTVVVRDRQTRPTLSPERLQRVVEVAREAELAAGRPDPAAGAVGFAFVDDNEMVGMHERFRGQARTTDVLSFPDELGAAAGAGPLRDAGPVYWGDVIVCTDQARRQAGELRHPYMYELLVLALHGVLHLLGHDHTRDGGEMVALEEALRPRCTAGGSPWS